MASKPTCIAELRSLTKTRLSSLTKADIMDVLMSDTSTDPAMDTLIKEVRELRAELKAHRE